MKRFNILLVFLSGILGCFGQQDSGLLVGHSGISGTYLGTAFEVEKLQTRKEVWQKYYAMATTDTLALQFKTRVKEICKVKGCWMIVELNDGEYSMVRFKNYAFFMPFDILEKDVVLNGLAFVTEMSIEDQKHYATDSGKTVDEMANITVPKRTYSFEASGVLIPN